MLHRKLAHFSTPRPTEAARKHTLRLSHDDMQNYHERKKLYDLNTDLWMVKIRQGIKGACHVSSVLRQGLPFPDRCGYGRAVELSTFQCLGVLLDNSRTMAHYACSKSE